MKHTPGPWQAKNEYEPLTIIGNIDGPDEGWMRYTDICEVADGEEALANARVMIAAPELLEALKGVVRVADRATQEFDAARAAIAKATGEAP